MKKIRKTTVAKIVCGVVLVAVCIGIIVFLFKDAYKPDEETLGVVNEAAVMLYKSEISDNYKRQGTENLDGTKLYIFEFTLKNGNKAVFAFARDLKETHKLYTIKNGEFSLVMFIDNSSNEKIDNDAEWPDSWSE